MSLHPEPVGPVPEETARVARAAFPKGNVDMQLREVLGVVYEDASFAPLFAARGRPAEAPWRLALVTVMQFAAGLSDRRAAEAVRARIDWKYAPGPELADPGFDFSVLSEFRARLVGDASEQMLLDALLAACKARGYLKARGRQRTDSTHVPGALRVLHRPGCVAETLRAALNAAAEAAPDWLRELAPPEWFERYRRRIEEYRLPRGREARQAYAATVGADGLRLLEAAWAPTAPAPLRRLAPVEILRRTWVQQYLAIEDQPRLREPKDMPPPAAELESPHEPEARYGAKGGQSWIGYKVHLTESRDAELPHLLTQVTTTVATDADIEQLAAVQAGLARAGLLPARHLVDAGYIRGRNLVASAREHRVDPVGPMPADHQWQAKAEQGFDLAHFRVDWDAKVVTCPQGRPSARWCKTRTARDRTMVHVAFAPADCTPCPVRARCTRAKHLPRGLMLQERAEHEAIRAARRRQQTEEFAAEYARRAGVEGTLSRGVRACGLRQARYRGQAKTHPQRLATAAAMNVGRLVNWLCEAPRRGTRCSHFAAPAPAS